MISTLGETMGRRSAHAGGGPSQRQLRVGEELRHVLAELLIRGGLREPALAGAQQLRGEAARRMRLKYAPDLTFRADHSFAEAARIEALLAEERAAVGSASHEDDDGAQ